MKAKRKIRSVAITGDVDRPLPQEKNIRFFYEMLKFPMELLGLDVTSHTKAQKYLSFPEWLKREESEVWNHSLDDKDWDHETLVIGFEIPRALELQLEKHGIPFLSIGIHPLRFMDDLAIAVKNSSTFLQLPESIDHVTILAHAQYMKAAQAMRPGLSVPENSVLLVGQTSSDRSVVDKGEFKSVLDFKEEILNKANGREIFYKPHPHNNDSGDVCHAFKAHSAALTPIYKLLSQSQFEMVIGLSSSVLYEAEYFNKESIWLLPPKPLKRCYHSSRFFNTLFWHSFLNENFQGHNYQLPSKYMEIMPYQPHLLRRGLNEKWGYDL